MSLAALSELMNGYFHQDWDTYGADDEQVVRVFVADDPELAALLPDEIDVLLRGSVSEAELETLLRSFGCETDPFSTDGSYRTWLTQLAAYAREALT
jgi:hypothetical protein